MHYNWFSETIHFKYETQPSKSISHILVSTNLKVTKCNVCRIEDLRENSG